MKNRNETVIAKTDFDLDRGCGKTPLRGTAVLYGDRAEIKTSGEALVLDTSRAVSYRINRGIGCVSLEAVTDDGYMLICRGTMEYFDNFCRCQKRMNAYLKKRSGGASAAEAAGAEGHNAPNQGSDTNIGSDSASGADTCGGAAPDSVGAGRICPKCRRPLPPGSTVCPKCAPKKQYLRRLWKMAKPYHGYIYSSVVLYFIIAGLQMLHPYVNRILVDDYIKADTMPVPAQYIIVVAMLLAVQVAARLLTMLRSYLQNISASKIIVMLRSVTFEKIESMSLSRISKRTSGELINRVTGDTGQIQQFISSEIGSSAENILMLVGITVLLITYDWRLALMVLLPAPLVMLSHRLMWEYLGKRYGRQWMLRSRASTVLHNAFSGIRVVKSFGTEEYEKERYDSAISEERKTQTSNETFFALTWPVTSFFMGLGEFFLLYFVGNKILDGTMTLGEMQQFSIYVSMIYGPLRWMSGLTRRLSYTMTSVAKVFDVIDEESDVSDKAGAVDTDACGEIEIDNVSFGYDGAAEVLKNVDLTIRPGEMIGIVGRSGVGKSTLINLIMRLYDPDEGAIRIGGVDIRDIKQESLRHHMGVVLQETMLFGGTLYENIAYAKPGASAEEVVNAAKLAGVHKFAVRLSDGYDTVIGEKGYTLSGGERQRVAIARALLHDPRILILDEATSALDTETEKDIQDALQKLIAGRTTIAIAHRLSTLRNATRLVVLDKGTVAEVGTHMELMKKKGLYYELVMAQRQMSKMVRVQPSA